MTDDRVGIAERAALPVYSAVWHVLVRFFRVPEQPPTVPTDAPQSVLTFRSAPGFLRLMKFWFWLFMWIPDLLILGAWFALLMVSVPLGVVLLVPALLLAIVPDILVYVAIHLRYDTTWYAISERSMRIRRGIWTIHEITITFENVQNIRVRQGPMQRWFGIADLVVETAGGGGGSTPGSGGQAHVGLIEGVADAAMIRDRILAQVKKSRSAGLGDDEHRLDRVGSVRTGDGPAWSPAHLAVLREIREAARSLRTLG